jgi:phospholipid transport system transporter-binding protein
VIRREGDRIVIAGPVTLENVTGLLAEGLAHVRAGASLVDMAGVSELDSSLLAAILALLREARRANRSLALSNLPAGLQTLAELYGVEELLPVA